MMSRDDLIVVALGIIFGLVALLSAFTISGAVFLRAPQTESPHGEIGGVSQGYNLAGELEQDSTGSSGTPVEQDGSSEGVESGSGLNPGESFKAEDDGAGNKKGGDAQGNEHGASGQDADDQGNGNGKTPPKNSKANKPDQPPAGQKANSDKQGQSTNDKQSPGQSKKSEAN